MQTDVVKWVGKLERVGGPVELGSDGGSDEISVVPLLSGTKPD